MLASAYLRTRLSPCFPQNLGRNTFLNSRLNLPSSLSRPARIVSLKDFESLGKAWACNRRRGGRSTIEEGIRERTYTCILFKVFLGYMGTKLASLRTAKQFGVGHRPWSGQRHLPSAWKLLKSQCSYLSTRFLSNRVAPPSFFRWKLVVCKTWHWFLQISWCGRFRALRLGGWRALL